jgi:hypothetical protein
MVSVIRLITSIPHKNQSPLVQPFQRLGIRAFPQRQDLRRLSADFEDRGMETLEAAE